MENEPVYLTEGVMLTEGQRLMRAQRAERKRKVLRQHNHGEPIRVRKETDNRRSDR